VTFLKLADLLILPIKEEIEELYEICLAIWTPIATFRYMSLYIFEALFYSFAFERIILEG